MRERITLIRHAALILCNQKILRPRMDHTLRQSLQDLNQHLLPLGATDSIARNQNRNHCDQHVNVAISSERLQVSHHHRRNSSGFLIVLLMKELLHDGVERRALVRAESRA